MSQIIQLLIYGLQLGCIYALIALGYSMVYAIISLINFAHADFLMLGCFTTYFVIGAVKIDNSVLNFIVGLLVAMIAAGIVGVLSERIAYKPLRNAPKTSLLITALGVSMFLQNFPRALPAIGPSPRAFPSLLNTSPITIGDILVPQSAFVTIIMGLALMIGLSLFVSKTKIGRMMTATRLDKEEAALVGINVNFVIATTFFVGGMLAGAGGVFYASTYPTIDVAMGSVIGTKAFIASVVGGIGNMKGAMLGGILMGIIEMFATSWNSDLGYGVAFVILIIILIFKPAGLLGKFTVEKV